MDNERTLAQIIGRNIRQQRKLVGVSAGELADAIGIPRTYMTHYEHGNKNVSITDLNRIAQELKVDLSVLLDVQERYEPCRYCRGSGLIPLGESKPE